MVNLVGNTFEPFDERVEAEVTIMRKTQSIHERSVIDPSPFIAIIKRECIEGL